MKLISLCPSNTELVAYLGLSSSLIGVDDFSDWPAEVSTLPRLGPDLNIDIEMAAALKPDLVLASLSVPGMERNIKELEKHNLPYVIVPNPKTLKEVGDCLLFVGKVTGTLEKATRVHEKFNRILEHYDLLSKRVPVPKTVYWEWWAKPVFTPGGSNWLTEMSRLAGGRNVFEDHPEASVQTDWDDVKQRNPDVIGVVWVGVHKKKVNPKVIKKRPGWDEMKAMQNNQLYILDEPLFCRPSPLLLNGLAQIAHILHPEIFPKYKEGTDLLLS
ncbi:ABC transporter substrate-binding protein [Bacillus sp. FJAT-18017]|uniref:cobalamin-binding protein n=1 Tax=Bacillus sp. FJAT-18017 TaxID=1705566 RepID=UPI0006AEDD81|nr:cobalamin-binding protein [Bacillus sp. FJAT-18017]ALC90723.1 ABC transporter substrate-binding protein [Bacillus sp. FJAT-18017]